MTDFIYYVDRLAEASYRLAETNRRLGFAKGQIVEVIGLLEDVAVVDGRYPNPESVEQRRYWAVRGLIRAKDMLESGDIR